MWPSLTPLLFATGPQPPGWPVNTAKHFHIRYLTGSSIVSPIRKVVKQRPSKTGMCGAEPRLAPLGLSVGAPLLTWNSISQCTGGRGGPGVPVPNSVAFLGGEWYKAAPAQGATCSQGSAQEAAGEIGLTSEVDFVFCFAGVFFFFLLRTIHFGSNN